MEPAVPQNDSDLLAARFEESRPHLRAVAYRMLGSLSEAEDAVQEAWFRLDRTDVSGVQNLGGWLTTVVGRVCLDQLRSRKARREESVDAFPERLPDPVVSREDGADPEQQALLSDSVGYALLVVLDRLGPAERLAFVLHDMFAVPFEDIAPIVEKTPAATRQLASRARRRVQGGTPKPDTDTSRRREVVGAFLAAARDGDFDGLLTVLDPDVVLRVDLGAVAGGMAQLVRGATAVAQQALMFSKLGAVSVPVLVNGMPGAMAAPNGRPQSLMDLTIVDGRIVEINILADPERIAALDLAGLGG
ncbi:sigma-70 family RNA polymerase sigma factor [Streptomyces sp. NRRL S-87]|uniref:sigma-70 family RNA polymerase sigma factor n=1 Tax=Streptomyces sp. NRRL S-87 TaxID=1463920 RepID=UPI0004BECB32|nr:sigma-70 family RNA polymerase sigma factor [Streptomyces sp. NRRL S-87]